MTTAQTTLLRTEHTRPLGNNAWYHLSTGLFNSSLKLKQRINHGQMPGPQKPSRPIPWTPTHGPARTHLHADLGVDFLPTTWIYHRNLLVVPGPSAMKQMPWVCFESIVRYGGNTILPEGFSEHVPLILGYVTRLWLDFRRGQSTSGVHLESRLQLEYTLLSVLLASKKKKPQYG
jgi:hypothetical protein